MPTYIGMVKFRNKPTRETIKKNLDSMEEEKKRGITYKGIYWTLGRYDAIVIAEAPDEKTMMKGIIGRSDWMSSETMVGIPAEEARKLVE